MWFLTFPFIDRSKIGFEAVNFLSSSPGEILLDVASQNIVLFTLIAVKTSNPEIIQN
jgi:hypothetical protein